MTQPFQWQDSTSTSTSSTLRTRQPVPAQVRESGVLDIDSPLPGPGPSTPPPRHQQFASPSTLEHARRTHLPPSREASPHTPRKRPRLVQSSRSTSPFASPASHSTLHRAVNTALPPTPSQSISTPPSSFPVRLNESVELHPLSPRAGRESPFDDRYSISVEPIQEDPFEYAGVTYRQRMGSSMTSMSPSSDTKIGSDQRGMPLATSETLRGSEARKSLYPSVPLIPIKTVLKHPDLDAGGVEPAPAETAITPTFRGLLAYHTTRDYILFLFPAIACSMLCSLVQPYMSVTIGEAFDAFAQYPLDNRLATAANRTALQDGVRVTTIKLAVTGAAAMTLNYIKGVLWARHGENLTHRLRHAVYNGVQSKTMEWYDMGMGMKVEGEDDAVGAGGLMAKFTRETDEVRMGTSQALGLVIQNLSTFIACFVLAMATQPILALVTLSTIPLVVIIQFVTQIFAMPLYTDERRANAEASTNIERATSAIATVKAHNAQKAELERFQRVAGGAKESLMKQSMVWACSISSTDFLLLGTFVVGFWYGAQVVREGKASAGTVMTVFWACLIAATFLQMVIPQLAMVTLAKNSMASLRTVIQGRSNGPASISNPFSSDQSPTEATLADVARPDSLGGLAKCRGEFNLQNVSFAYPSRPDNVVLRNITLFIPPGETTFIVGGSGSGKSTIAQLLLRLYPPNGGIITMDDQLFGYLDEKFTREHIAAVQQGCILFDMSVHDNVAMGAAGSGSVNGHKRSPKDVTRAEVVEACKMAMIHDFIESLPEGYDTNLGTGGSALSGGQRQRLAIARARIRNPTVLILDEATSALDATSRVIVFENMKQWRRNQTTIVITHDLSQIVPDDFVYVMANGVVAEQGFRSDLVKRTPLNGQATGVFAAMAAEQALEPLPPKVEEWKNRPESEEVLADDEDAYDAYSEDKTFRPHTPAFGMPGRESLAYFDVLDSYARGSRASKRLSTSQKRLSWGPSELDKRISRTSLVVPGAGSRNSLVVSPRPGSRMSQTPSRLGRSISRETDRPSLDLSSIPYDSPRMDRSITLEKEDQEVLNTLRYSYLRSESKAVAASKSSLEIINHTPGVEEAINEPTVGIFKLLLAYYPTLPRKSFLYLGFIGAISHGAATPLWSFFLAKLMTIVASGGTDPSLTKFGLIVLALSFGQALADWVQQYFHYSLAAIWADKLRGEAYTKILAQDKGWFDQSSHAPARLVQSIIKDADDMRLLISSVMGKFVVFVIMVGLGIIWALAVDWRLTLIGIGLAPVYAIVMMLNNSLIGKAEVKNKAKREEAARTFYESVANVRGIRAMALEGTFHSRFDTDAAAALRTGKHAGWVIAIGIGFIAGVPLFAQALMNWAGSVFILKGYINYAQMLQVYNLILFSLTMGTALLNFIPAMAKGRAAATDFNRYYHLSTDTAEASGDFRFPISGQVTFSSVSFSYPTRPDLRILSGLSLSFHPGEAVAVVGPSGSGKSTIAALLQKLYEPCGGSIHFDKYDLARADVKWLRNHIAVVSQSANLFDATVSQNIAYGSDIPIGEIQRAARAANIHDFIQSLPQGYDTNLGENASLISGGQAQRLQIARALVRRSRILILDECTSALDVDNQRAILDTIVKIKETRTTIFITHSVEAMKRCDRILCLGEGRVMEEGSFEQLVRRQGVFAQLMKTGEWE